MTPEEEVDDIVMTYCSENRTKATKDIFAAMPRDVLERMRVLLSGILALPSGRAVCPNCGDIDPHGKWLYGYRMLLHDRVEQTLSGNWIGG